MGGSEEPGIEWFRSGTFDPNKFDPYLFNPDHPADQGKAEGWREVFDIGRGDGLLLQGLIRKQLDQATIVEQKPTVFGGEPHQVARRWELLIPEFRGPNGNVAPVLTAWALEPPNTKPHFVTAYVRTD